LFSVLLVVIAAAAAGIAWRQALGSSLVVLVVFILGDQHRFQAWVYQYVMVALLLATLPAASGLALARGWYVATYAYSGLSKLDASFCSELGARFLETGGRLVGLDPAGWLPPARIAAILAMPAWELAVALALGLNLPVSRRLGRPGAVVLHGALIAILGPWGMGHSAIVLVWNLAMLIQVWLAFGPEIGRATAAERVAPRYATPLGWLARGAFAAGVVLPLGERSGYCDAWPAHALYASHVERTEVLLHEDELGAYPAAVQRHVHVQDGTMARSGPWRRLDLTGWSREFRGVPVYPQARACNGLAESLAARYGDPRLIQVIQWGRADRWSGARAGVTLRGLEEIRRQGAQYRLNAHPSAGDPRL
jgi:hypothetical protein